MKCIQKFRNVKSIEDLGHVLKPSSTNRKLQVVPKKLTTLPAAFESSGRASSTSSEPALIMSEPTELISIQSIESSQDIFWPQNVIVTLARETEA